MEGAQIGTVDVEALYALKRSPDIIQSSTTVMMNCRDSILKDVIQMCMIGDFGVNLLKENILFTL